MVNYAIVKAVKVAGDKAVERLTVRLDDMQDLVAKTVQSATMEAIMRLQTRLNLLEQRMTDAVTEGISQMQDELSVTLTDVINDALKEDPEPTPVDPLPVDDGAVDPAPM